MNCGLICSCLVLASPLAFSQNEGTIILQGQVVSESSGTPVHLADVYIKNSITGTVTDSLGIFMLQIAESYTADTLCVSSMGFALFRESLSSLIAAQPVIIELRDTAYQIQSVSAFNYHILAEMFQSSQDGSVAERILVCPVREYETIVGFTKILIADLGKAKKRKNTVVWKRISPEKTATDKLDLSVSWDNCRYCPGDNDYLMTIEATSGNRDNVLNNEEADTAIKKYLQKAVDLTFTQGTDFSHLEKRKGIWYRENEETPYTGKCIGYFNSGERGLSGSYQDGQRSGHWIYWYRNGQKKMEGNFISGRSHGKLSYWYEDGIVKVDARYYLGKIDGHNRYFYKNGSLAKETWYENGKPMGWIIYNKRGKITERFGELGKNDSR